MSSEAQKLAELIVRIEQGNSSGLGDLAKNSDYKPIATKYYVILQSFIAYKGDQESSGKELCWAVHGAWADTCKSLGGAKKGKNKKK